MNIFQCRCFFQILKASLALAVILLWSCSSISPSQITILSGVAMTIPYKLTVGRTLSLQEKEKLLSQLNGWFEEVNRTFNDYNPQSELSLINRADAGRWIPLSPRLEQLLTVADRLVKATEGRFDPTILPLKTLWKQNLSRQSVPAQEEIDLVKIAVGWDKILLKPGYLYKEHPKVQMDLGGIAKGYCVDMIVENCLAQGFSDLLFDWGGEIRAAGVHPTGRQWKIFISHMGSHEPSQAIATLDLNNQAIATSGDYCQSWSVSDSAGRQRRYTHIIDAATGRALEVTDSSIAAVSVLADNCTHADAFATALMLFPTADEASRWAEKILEDGWIQDFWIVNHSLSCEP